MPDGQVGQDACGIREIAVDCPWMPASAGSTGLRHSGDFFHSLGGKRSKWGGYSQTGPKLIALRRVAGLIGICVIGATAYAASPGRADEGAVARLTRALAAEEAHDGKTSPYLLPVLEELAQAQLRDGALGDAAALRRRALDIAIAAFGCDSPSAAEAMAALAVLDIDRRRYLDAEPLLIVAERVLRGRVDPDHPAMATVFAGLARIALARGDNKPAEAWARRALKIAQANPQGRSAEPLRTLGAVLTAAERFDEAERVLNEALAQDRAQHGADALDTARSLSQLGNLYLRAHRAKDALPPIEEAAAIDQDRLGPTHPFIADDLHDLGLAYEALHRRDDAREAFSAAIDVLERGAGRETPRVAYAELELSRLDRQAGKDAAADAAFKDAQRILNKAEAEEHKRQREV
jgi:tetratricopeptide (TPR) repeat protein